MALQGMTRDVPVLTGSAPCSHKKSRERAKCDAARARHGQVRQISVWLWGVASGILRLIGRAQSMPDGRVCRPSQVP